MLHKTVLQVIKLSLLVKRLNTRGGTRQTRREAEEEEEEEEGFVASR